MNSSEKLWKKNFSRSQILRSLSVISDHFGPTIGLKIIVYIEVKKTCALRLSSQRSIFVAA